MAPSFNFDSREMAKVHWSSRGSCGNPGCKDKECGCALCGLPIGIPEDDPRLEDHPEYCTDCDLCRDQVPIQLFRGEGKAVEQAQFHTKCFEKLMVKAGRA
jgi:hypothetical protein